MDEPRYRLRVFRYDPLVDAEPRYQEFDVEIPDNHTVLQALLKIQDEQDGTLAFRFACRGAVCGSCAMAIDDRLTLACRTQLSNFPTRHLTVEPLPNLAVIKDLMVDMDPFWRAYEAIEPWLHTAGEDPVKERRVREEDTKVIDQFVNCILCASCYGACPVLGRDPSYIGPAALAKLQRFVADTRDVRTAKDLAAVNDEKGVWGCDTVFRCIEHCPKDVRPYDGIGALRRRLVAGKLLPGGGRSKP